MSKYYGPRLIISKLEYEVMCGDWHDKPLRWAVSGQERQLFATKRDAQKWASIRRRSASFSEAQDAWLAQP